eukprot:5896134-Prymnesium_polylepis.1
MPCAAPCGTTPASEQSIEWAPAGANSGCHSTEMKRSTKYAIERAARSQCDGSTASASSSSNASR